jgi:hypothetical protein
MFFNVGAACQRVEPLNLPIEFVADVTLQDQGRNSVIIGVLCLQGCAGDVGTRLPATVNL